MHARLKGKDMNNAERAERAGLADESLALFAINADMNMLAEAPEVVGDLLADIMHWCDRYGVNFEERLANARMHYDAEVNGGD